MGGRTGRPKGDRAIVRATLYLDAEVVERADELARQAGLSRSELINDLLNPTLKGLKLARMAGILDWRLLVRDFATDVEAWGMQSKLEWEQTRQYWDEGQYDDAKFEGV